MTQSPEPSPLPTREGSGLRDLSEDATGFGAPELRTIRDALVRPAAMLDAYMTQGQTAGGVYARPLRFYLTLCGLMTLVQFLMGGSSVMLEALPADLITGLVEDSGKSRDAFMSDADSWMSLVMVPIDSAFYALLSTPLLRLWDPEDLGWRRGFRATFHFLNVWSLPILPFIFLSYLPSTMAGFTLVMALVGFIAFLRVGKGRWYRSMSAGLIKAAVMTTVTFVGTFVATVPVIVIGLIGGSVG